MIVLVDYGIGNLRSVYKALQAVGADVLLSSRPGDIRRAEKLILPGVGAFGDGMAGLQARGLIAPLQQAVQAGRPLLGICLGMQLLFRSSDEAPGVPGLGWLDGRVRRFPPPERTPTGRRLKVPHTGWNRIFPLRSTPLLAGLPAEAYAYFNHAYYCQPAVPETALASTTHGLTFASVVGRKGLYGVQFHPEKSQTVGLHILKNFVERIS